MANTRASKQMKIYICNSLLLIILQMFLTSCGKNNPKVKSTFWVKVIKNNIGETVAEEPYRYEHFNINGVKIYDSTLFISGLGYRVNKYENGMLISSIAKYDPDIVELTLNKYDDHGNLVKSIIGNNDDTTSVFYKNNYDGNDKLLEIWLYENGDTIPKLLYQRSYNDSLLNTVKIYKNNSSSFQLLKEVTYKYDSNNRMISLITQHLQQNVKDSTSINYDDLTTSTFRSLGNNKYELVSLQKVFNNDSTEFEIFNPQENNINLIKRKSVEYWE